MLYETLDNSSGNVSPFRNFGVVEMKHRLLRYFGQPGNSWRYALAHDYGFHTNSLFR